MKKVAGILLFLCCFAGAIRAQSDSAKARTFVKLNANGQYQKAWEYFAPAIRPRVSPQMLKTIWNKYINSYGAYQDIGKMALTARDSVRIWMTHCNFEKAEILLALTFNDQEQLVGYFVRNIIPKKEKTSRPNETDTTIAVEGGTVAGTLLLPEKHHNKVPVVLIIPGSGPVDRDGNVGMALQANTYKMLADSLAAHGIASFRYDKRGIGKSAALLTGEKDLRFSDYVKDAVAIVRFLKQDGSFSDVIIAGHSQGSLVGILAAQQVDIGGFISLEGAGEPVSKILYWQLSRKKNEGQKQLLKKTIDSLQAGQNVTSKNPLFRPSLQPFLTSWMQIDPAEEIQKLPMPVLIINGTTDLQVIAQQAEKLAGAAPTARVQIINGMNHVLKDAPEERTANLATYRNPDLPLNKELVMDIITFINSL